ncbi:aminotransferase class V-fold PLP-dependent enzyme [Chryseosolibacter indicus]|uniref:phosphoserine transaminase n=1 Tax=Chryseosolibacter indicus TaxID=2782351 RepID=A0ABS5VLC8_9BACT|nr:aminotransferase class V-fold PLP-dependent enzyme [Chryseosolibacter indicus]MBT1701669.1 aminotransferase class V-fold PLP-dependent enzyme [Chryseosolibacter indicus]
MIHTNFTPGPSQLYFTVSDHARQAFKEGIPSISHRSKQFEQISKETTDGLRQLLSIPDNFYIFFTSSATEVWERIIQNLVAEKSFHLINGSFSKRFHEIAIQLNKKAEKLEAKEGEGFTGEISVQDNTELIAVTHNETSTGVVLPIEFINQFKEKNKQALVVVDVVSSMPYPQFDFSKIDSVFFSVQKGFGLPAGLGVWIVNQHCIEKAEALLKKGISIGSYHNIPTLVANAAKNQTPETPNVLGIYLLNKIIQDFLRKGIDTIRRETDYKAAILYHALEQHALLSPFVKDKNAQSKTVIVADCQNHTEKLTKFLLEKGLQPGDGYGSSKKTQLRFANFPAHSKEQYELLVDSLAAFQG